MENKQKYTIAEKTVEWNWDNNEHSISKSKTNNLCIYDGDILIWDMSQLLKRDDICVDLKIVNDSVIRFITYNGWNIVFDVQQMKMISKNMTK